jgi:type IV secretion system protein VirB11
MGSVRVKPEAASHNIDMLHTAMGVITSWLDDPTIVEVMLYPNGRLWIARLAGGLSDTGKRLSGQAPAGHFGLWLSERLSHQRGHR